MVCRTLYVNNQADAAMTELIIFYVFAAITVFAATMVVTVRNPVQAALSLVLAFFASAGIWMLLEAEFLAIVLVVVYVGAVMVLFLFVVMMLDINLVQLKEGFVRFLPFGLVTGITMLILLVMAVGPEHFGLGQIMPPMPHTADYNNTRELGKVLYTDYIFAFEIAAVILLVAIIAAISLTMRPKRTTKTQRPEVQVNVRREDRVRLVKMQSERRS